MANKVIVRRDKPQSKKEERIIIRKIDNLTKKLTNHMEEEMQEMRHMRGKTNAGIAQAVYDQLSEDYDKKYMGWIKAAEWSGPEDVPIKEIDVSNRHKWAASEDQSHVDDFLEQVKSGNVKPIILVNEPNNNKMMIVDGHHRFLAHEKAKMPTVRAYVATVGGVGGDWVKMHDRQDDHGVESQQASQQESKQK